MTPLGRFTYTHFLYNYFPEQNYNDLNEDNTTDRVTAVFQFINQSLHVLLLRV